MSKQKPLALIVEDRPEVAAIWAANLAPLEITVVHAINLDQAYAQLSRIPPPDLILLDLNLGPIEKADHTVRQISRMKEFNPDVVIIVISGVITPELTEIAISQGAASVKEKLDMQQQVDLWNEIQVSLAKAPAGAKKLFSHSINLLETLTKAMHLL